MIDFRYHLVSIIAIFFALAAGIVLGAGPLKDDVDAGLTAQTAQLREENQDLREQIAAGEQLASYQESFADIVSPAVVGSRLTGRTVVLVSLPSAVPDTVSAVRDRLVAAGATVNTTVTIDDSWTATESGPALDALAAQLVTAGTTLPDGDGWDRGSAVLASALATTDTVTAEGGNTATVLQAFQAAGFIGIEGDPAQRGTLVVTVAGPAAEGEDAEREARTLVALTQALDDAGRGEVVAGSSDANVAGGVIAGIRADASVATEVSTVDVAELASGQQVIVLAAIEQENGQTGHYGAVDAPDGAAPAEVVPAG